MEAGLGQIHVGLTTLRFAAGLPRLFRKISRLKKRQGASENVGLSTLKFCLPLSPSLSTQNFPP